MTTRRTRTAQQEAARLALLDATAAYRQAKIDVVETRKTQREMIVAALDSGLRQVEIVGLAGFTREHIRRIKEQVDAERGVTTSDDDEDDDTDAVEDDDAAVSAAAVG